MDVWAPSYVREMRQFTFPFLLMLGDLKVVHRSNALQGMVGG